MLDVFRIASIQPPEQVERILAPHMVAFLPRLCASGALLVTPFFFLYDLHGWWWVVAVLFWVGGAWLGWWSALLWSRTMVLFTNRRIIGPTRIGWVRKMGEIPRHEVHEARWQPSRGIARLFGLGKATFIGGPNKTVITLGWCRGEQTTIALSLAERRRLLAQKLSNCSETEVAALEEWFAKQKKA